MVIKTSEFRGGGVLKDVAAVSEAATHGSGQQAENALQTWAVEPRKGTHGATSVWTETLTWHKDYLSAEDDPVLAELWDNADDAVYDSM